MTSRSKPLYKVGDTTNLMADKDYSKISGKSIKITKVFKKALSEFTESDAVKEGFENLNDFKRYWEENMGKWTHSTDVWVHEFEVISQ